LSACSGQHGASSTASGDSAKNRHLTREIKKQAPNQGRLGA
jgi:hypothetical protein